ncbi:MAG: hypothetical protein AABZ53_07595 [Planctomycetota bacterium]
MIAALKVASVAGLALLVGKASAFIPWTNPNMNAGNYYISGGGSDNGLCGSPMLVNAGTTLVYFPFQFSTGISGGGISSVGDRDTFDLVDAPGSGYSFTSISVAENGTYSTSGAGQVLSTPVLTVTNLTTLAVFTTNLTVNYSGGIWVALGSVNITGWTSGEFLRVEIFNTLTATTFGGGDSASIDKSTVQRDEHGGLEVTIVPAPASILPLIGALALRRRR